MPYAFTEQGVAMLSSILNSDTAIEVNIAIMRTFVAVRRLVAAPILPASPTERIEKLEHDVQVLKEYMEEVFTDQNDINEDTRVQLELINQPERDTPLRNAQRKAGTRRDSTDYASQ